MAESDQLLTVTLWRGSAQGGAYQTVEVPRQESQTVLDVVSWVQQYEDPSLTYRFACRVGMCGSCAMMVNGVPRWTCRTHVRKVVKDGKIQIAPLRNFPVIKDLAVDMDGFFDKWTAAGGVHVPTADRSEDIVPIDPETPARETANAGIECINCAVCYAACDTVAGDPDYLGPAPLLRAWTLLNDEKHGDRAGLLDQVSGRGGCHACHSMGSCAANCPNELDPMSAIAGLKRASARRFFGRGT